MGYHGRIGWTIRMSEIPEGPYEQWNQRARSLGAVDSFTLSGTSHSHFTSHPKAFYYTNFTVHEHPRISVSDIAETKAQFDARVREMKEEATIDRKEWHQC